MAASAVELRTFQSPIREVIASKEACERTDDDRWLQPKVDRRHNTEGCQQETQQQGDHRRREEKKPSFFFFFFLFAKKE
jgi:hypothetical protein